MLADDHYCQKGIASIFSSFRGRISSIDGFEYAVD